MSTHTTEYPSLIAYLKVNNATAAIEFYKTAFGATERQRLTHPETGKIGHCELDLNGSLLMLADEQPGFGKSATTLGGTPVTFCLTVENTDAAIERACAAGATSQMPVMDMFYGFRCGSIRDPFGNEWMLQHPIENVSHEELQKRWSKMVQKDCPAN